ncbi:hypothetical protein SAMN04488055_0003 [Chitinophaga niabensis]|uniref:Uncharacterized protein n=1 Tax=Chitinophaga niabensis TaxID=536979 RepID=A0A1N6D041_9BACT|nr:hypothetical protein SAMN04488055_0003 [Chitinophaga niabensis]
MEIRIFLLYVYTSSKRYIFQKQIEHLYRICVKFRDAGEYEFDV